MSTPCTFKRQDDGRWQCINPSCGFVTVRPHRRAPVRVCTTPHVTPTHTRARTRGQVGTHTPPGKRTPREPGKGERVPLLGDVTKSALETLGITSEKVEQWLGRPCGCERRREKMNELDRWARRVVSGKTEKAEEYLGEIIDE